MKVFVELTHFAATAGRSALRDRVAALEDADRGSQKYEEFLAWWDLQFESVWCAIEQAWCPGCVGLPRSPLGGRERMRTTSCGGPQADSWRARFVRVVTDGRSHS